MAIACDMLSSLQLYLDAKVWSMIEDELDCADEDFELFEALTGDLRRILQKAMERDQEVSLLALGSLASEIMCGYVSDPNDLEVHLKLFSNAVADFARERFLSRLDQGGST